MAELQPYFLQAKGAKVVVNDIDAEPAEKTVEEIRAAKGQCILAIGDVTDPNFAESVIQKTVSTWDDLHILVNNAGYTWNKMIHKMSDEQWGGYVNRAYDGPVSPDPSCCTILSGNR